MCIYHVYNYIFFVICILVTLNFSQQIQNTEFLINSFIPSKIFPKYRRNLIYYNYSICSCSKIYLVKS